MIQHARGISFEYVEARVSPRDRAYAAGEVGQLDLARSHASTTNANLGSTGSCFYNVVSPTLNGSKFGIAVLFLEAVPQGGEGRALIRGRAKGIAGSSVAAGAPLAIQNGSNELEEPATTGQKIVAVAEAAGSGLIDLWFDGQGLSGTYLT